ncbi:unnamed protein product [Darwinula stevensoni]|uniref:Uncharacterized protein n=1 Tax=Darwinula stevensoni TaxID=69355 RepID=A0A7R9FRT1_9CRUS|nr:unnamed protein product [Darwinula stevensoni]CAG0902055.1 unnamed protein product [Darwinula stevensoni]
MDLLDKEYFRLFLRKVDDLWLPQTKLFLQGIDLLDKEYFRLFLRKVGTNGTCFISGQLLPIFRHEILEFNGSYRVHIFIYSPIQNL